MVDANPKRYPLHPLGFLLCTEHPGVEKGRGRGLWAVELTIRFTAEKRKQVLNGNIAILVSWVFGGTNNDVVCPLKKKHNKPKNPAT